MAMKSRLPPRNRATATSSAEMRAAGRTLREIAPGLATLLVLEDAPDLVPAGG